jgi:paraquat-inducible protein A
VTQPHLQLVDTRGHATGVSSCLLCKATVETIGERPRCPRCLTRVRIRQPESLQRTTALLLAAALLYIPANLLPIMNFQKLGSGDDQTILSGVVHLAEGGFWGLATVVFVASVVVPVLKFIGLGFLVATVRFGWASSRLAATRVHHIVEVVGRWSMIDVFTIALLVALVQLGLLASVEAGPGALYFALVVVLTMLASQTFDPRLLWDTEENR